MNTNGGKERLSAITTATLAALLLFAASARASFEDLGAGARGPGMGNAFTAIADDVYAIYYNPAGLALLARPELAAAYTQHLAGLSDGSGLNTSFLGYVYPLRRGNGALGAAMQNFSIDGSFYSERAFYLSYGRAAPKGLGLDGLYWGLNLKNLRRSFGSLPEASNAYNGLLATGAADPVLSGNSAVSAFDADFGLLYRLSKDYCAGLELLHLARPDMAFSSADTDRLPMHGKLGFGYGSMVSNITAQYETLSAPAGSRDHRLTMALERWFPWLLIGNIGARAALSVGSREFRQATAGLSYRAGRISVDYGFSMPINTIASTSGSHRLSFSVRFGPAKEEEKSVKMVLEAMRSIKTGKAPETGQVPESKAAIQVETLLKMASEAIEDSRYNEAVDMSEIALIHQPENLTALENLGISYFAMGNYYKSLKAWEKAYKIETNQARLAMIKSQIESVGDIINQHEGEAAAPAPPIRAAKPGAAEVDAALVQKLYREGLDLYSAGELEKARAMFQKVLEADPANIPAANAVKRIQREHK
jgi:tetratricopeptide (TPR) repeat protein